MNKDIQNIFENYTNSWNMTPKESFKRDKRFFSYVIENNRELHPLKSLPTKVIFELYKLKLRSFYDTQHPGVITENTNLTDKEAFDILQESTKDVTNKEAYLGVKDVFTHLTFDYLYERYLHLRVKPVVKEQYSGRVRQDVAELKRQIKQFMGANPRMAKDQRFTQLQQVVSGMDREGRSAAPPGAEETVTSTTDVTTTPPAPAPAPAPAAAPAPEEVDVTTDVATTPGTAVAAPGAVPPVIDVDSTVETEKPGMLSRMGGALKRGAAAVGRGVKKGAEAIAPTVGAIGGGLGGMALGGVPGAIAGGALGKSLGRGYQAGSAAKGGVGARLKAAGQGIKQNLGKDLATGAMVGGMGGMGAGGGEEQVDVDTEVDVAPEEYIGPEANRAVPAPAPAPAPEEVEVDTDVQINPNTGEPLPPPRDTQSAINPARGSRKGGGKLMDLARRGR